MGALGLWFVKQIMSEGVAEAAKAGLDELKKIIPTDAVEKVQSFFAEMHSHVTTSPAWAGTAPEAFHKPEPEPEGEVSPAPRREGP